MPSRKIALTLGLAGIIIEIVAIWLLATHRLPSNIVTPILIAGMFLAFVPIFVVARAARRRR